MTDKSGELKGLRQNMQYKEANQEDVQMKEVEGPKLKNIEEEFKNLEPSFPLTD